MKIRFVLSTTIATLLSSAASHAATLTWDGAGGSTWDAVTSNWTGSPWTDSSDALFAGSGTGAITVSGTRTVTSLTTSAAGYSLTGGQINLGSATTTFTINNDLLIASIIGGNGLTKSGAGILTLTGVNTYSGGTTISSGTLRIGDGTTNGTVGSGTYSIAGGTTLKFQYNSSGGANPTWSKLTGAGTLELATAKTQDYSSWGGVGLGSSFTGTLQIDSGRVYNSGTGFGGATAVVIANGGQLGMWDGGTVSQNFTIAGGGYGEAGQASSLRLGNTTLTGNITLAASTCIGVSTGTATLSGVISGGTAASLSIGDWGQPGTLILAGSNTYTGATSILTGTVNLANPNALGAGGSISFNSATLQYSGSNQTDYSSRLVAGNYWNIDTNGQNVTYASGMPTTKLNKLGAGTLTLTGTNNTAYNTYGTFQVNGGVLEVSGSGILVATGQSISGAVNTGGTLRLNSTASTDGGLESWNLWNKLIVNGGTVETNLASGISLSCTMGANGATLGGSGIGAETGVLAGSGSLTKSGAGMWTLTGANTYTGATTVTSGTLQIGAGGTAGLTGFTSGIALSSTGSTLVFNRTDNYGGSFSPAISGSGNLVLTTGTLTLTGSNSYTGTTTVNGGILQLATVNALYGGAPSSWTAANLSVASGGTLAVNVGGTNEFTSGNVTTLLTNLSGSNNGLKAGATIGFDPTNAAGGTFIIADNLGNSSGTGGGAVGLTKLGANTLILTGSNTYTGATKISAGTLQIGNGTIDGSIAASSGITNSGTLAYNLVGSQSYGNIIGGTGALTKSGAGTLTLTGSNTYTGATTISSGTLQLGDGTTDGSISSSAITNNAALVFNLVGSRTQSGIISGSGTLTKSGPGTLTLSGSNTYSGPTVINSGTLQAGSTSAFGSNSAVTLANVAGATLVLNGYSNSIGSLAGGGGNGGNVLRGGNLTVGGDNTSTIYAGDIYGGNATVKVGTGTLTLTGTNNTTYNVSASFQVNGGVLEVAGAGILMWQYQWATSYVNAGGTLLLNSTATGDGGLNVANIGPGFVVNGGTIATNLASGISLSFTMGASGAALGGAGIGTETGALSGSGSLTKTGAGKWTLSGSNGYTGATNVNGGTLTLSNSNALAGGGAISFGGGTLQYSANNSVDYSGRIAGSGSAISIDTNGQNITFASNLALSNTGGLTKLGAGALTLTGSNAYTGVTTISAGMLSFSGTNALPGWNVAGRYSVAAGAALAVPDSVADGDLTSMLGTGNFAAGALFGFDTSAGDRTFAVNTGGSYGLAKVGANTLTVTGSNSYTAGTMVSGGVLKLGNANALGAATGALTVTSGTLDLNGNSLTVGLLSGGGGAIATSTTDSVTLTATSAASSTFGGAIQNGAGTVALTQAGAGTLTLTGSNSYSGGTTISSGTLRIGDGTVNGTLGGGTCLIAGGATLKFQYNTSGGTTPAYANISGAGTLELATAKSFDYTSLGQAGLGSGFTGTLQIDSGRIYTGVGGTGLGGATAVVVANGGQLGLWQGGTVSQNMTISGTGYGETGWNSALRLGNNTLTGNVALAANATIGAGNGTVAILSGIISGSSNATLTIADSAETGTVAVTGSNTYAGATVVNYGTLRIGNGGATGSIGSTSGVSLASGGTLAFNRSDDYGGGFSQAITGAGKVLLASGTLTLTGSNTYTGATTINGGTLALSNTIALAGGGNLAFGGGTLQYSSGNQVDYSGKIVSSGGAISIDTNSQNITFASSLAASNTGGLTKLGLGTLTLTGSNAYTGATTISAGTLQIGDGTTDGSIASSSGMTDNGAVAYNLLGNQSFGGVISGSGTLTKNGSGTLTLSGNNTFSGNTTVNAGVLQLNSQNAALNGTVALNVDNGLVFGGTAATLGGLSGSGALSLLNTSGSGVALSVGSNGANTTYSGVISGTDPAGTLTKVGVGTLTLTGSSTYVGLTTINNGYLQLGDGTSGHDALLATSSIANNCILKYDYYGDRSIGYSHSGNGTMWKMGAGTLTFTGSNAVGTIILISGTLQLGDGMSGHDGSLTGSWIFNNAALVYNTSGTQTAGYAISGPGTVTKNGPGTVIFSGANTYSGPTIINSGTLADSNGISKLSPNSAVVLANATNVELNLFTAETIGSLSGGGANGGNVVSAGPWAGLTIGGDNTSTTYAGSIHGGGVITKVGTGTLTLTGTNFTDFNTYNTVVVNSGVLEVSGSGILYGNGQYVQAFVETGGTLRLNSTATLDGGLQIGGIWRGLIVDGGSIETDLGGTGITNIYFTMSANGATLGGSGVGTETGALSGSGSLTKAGAGTWTLTGANTYTGATTVTSGTLQIGNGTTNGAIGTGTNSIASGATLKLNYNSAGATTPTWANINGAGTLELATAATRDSGWGQAALPAGFTGTLQIDRGRVSADAGGLGGATSVVIANGAQLGLWDGGTFSQNLTITGTGYGEGGQGSALRLGNTTLTGNITLAASAFIGVSTGTATIAGVISGGTAATLSIGDSGQTGTLILAGSNTYAGATVILNGTVNLANPNALGAGGSITFGAGTLQYSGSNQTDYSSRLVNGNYWNIDTNGQNVSYASSMPTTKLNKMGAGTLTLTATSNTAFNNGGSFQVNGGVLEVAGAGILMGNYEWASSYVNAGGTLRLNSTATGDGGLNINNIGIAFVVNGGTLETDLGGAGITNIHFTMGANGATLGGSGIGTETGALSGSGSLTKAGTGTWTLTGSNSYSGGTSVCDGTLKVGNANALGTGSLSVNGGTLNLNGRSVSVGALSGSGGTITNSGSGTSTLATTAASGTSTYAGNITDGTGAVVLTNSGADTLILSGSLTMSGLNANNGTVEVTQSGSIGAISIAAGATVTIAAHSGSTYNVLEISSLTISGSTSGLAVGNKASATGAILNADGLTGPIDYAALGTNGSSSTGVNDALFAVDAAPGSPEAVPEPGALGLILSGMGLLMSGRPLRRRTTR